MDPSDLLTPRPTPPLPRARLWWLMLVPFAATLIAVVSLAVAAIVGGVGAYGAVEPDFLILLPPFAGAAAALVALPWFVRLLRVRYAGTSLVLLSIGYLLGHWIIQPVLGFGGCLLGLAAGS